MGDKDYLPNVGGEVHRAMTRCKACRSWWSTDGKDITSCPCGGELEVVDMEAHAKTLPKVPYDPSKDPRLKK